jgi:hypothetical protein
MLSSTKPKEGIIDALIALSLRPIRFLQKQSSSTYLQSETAAKKAL